MSLKKKRAGFAKNHPSYPGDNLEHTSFMKLWNIELFQSTTGKESVEKTDNSEDDTYNEYVIPEEILMPSKDNEAWNCKEKNKNDNLIVIKITDCGGDAEYVLLTTLSITCLLYTSDAADE